MGTIYQDILDAKKQNRKLLAILLDPDKINWENLQLLISKISSSPAGFIFIGGSLVTSTRLDELILKIKESCQLPIVLFPGHPSQISPEADAILFLSLLSGRNPDYLIGHHVKSAPLLKSLNLEVLPTGYILIDGESESAVEKVSQTKPMPVNDPNAIVATAQAAELMGNRLIYLEAGSGAQAAVPLSIVTLVSSNIEIPLIIGGGITSQTAIDAAFNAGADLVVIGTAFENNINFFDK